MTGQMIIQYSERKMNEYLSQKFGYERDRVIAIDTDSIFVSLSDFHRKVIGDKVIDDTHKVIDVFDKFCKKDIEPKLAEWFNEMSKFMNVYEPRLHMKREKIIDSGLWRAKKNYIIQVWDNEGVRYNEAKMVAVGVEIARSSTPKIVKDALKKAISLILNGTEDEVKEFVSSFRKEFVMRPLDEISFPRGVSEMDKWTDPTDIWKKGTPIHVKGALVFNTLIHRYKMPMKEITSGDKIKFIYLKTPNPTHCNVISFHTHLPSEFHLDKYVDKDTQFQKTFLHPMKSFTDIIGWKTEEEFSVSDFFGSEDVVNQGPVSRPDLTLVSDSVTISPVKKSETKVKLNPTKPKKKQPTTIEGFF